ncbi:MAG: hypothetical protein COT09_02835 [Candidatus Hydromicrobium americanum]|nr:MAG: hypothetical protein COT09_02835 [Candidatus Hydromicrobium americanum]
MIFLPTSKKLVFLLKAGSCKRLSILLQLCYKVLFQSLANNSILIFIKNLSGIDFTDGRENIF